MDNLKFDKGPVTESQFYMWRAIFAMAHADHVVTNEEKQFMNRVLNEVNFSELQEETLRGDIEEAQDIGEMFVMIESQHDRSRFFYFARMLTWCDGDFDEQEQKILTELAKSLNKSVDITTMINDNDLQLENEQRQWIKEDVSTAKETGNVFSRFLKRFG